MKVYNFTRLYTFIPAIHNLVFILPSKVIKLYFFGYEIEIIFFVICVHIMHQTKFLLV